MAAKFLTLVVGPLRVWLHRRGERRALLTATEGLDHAPDALLNDIGISHDDMMALYAVATSRWEDRACRESGVQVAGPARREQTKAFRYG